MTDWGAVAQVVGSLASVGAAAAAVWAASEARKVRMEQTKPNVIVYLGEHEDVHEFLQLVVHNIGLAPAYSIMLNPVGEETHGGHTKIADTALAAEGIGILAPGGKVAYLMGMYVKVGEVTLNYTLTYYTGKALKERQRVETSITLRVTDFRGRTIMGNEERRAQKAITKAMTKLAGGQIEVTVKPKELFEGHLGEE